MTEMPGKARIDALIADLRKAPRSRTFQTLTSNGLSTTPKSG
jgi:hypothetical protein